MGSDSFCTAVSIHAPTGGATDVAGEVRHRGGVSIHAPTGGATVEGSGDEGGVLVSIHAPTGGATAGISRGLPSA